MSRFSGWSTKDLAGLNIIQDGGVLAVPEVGKIGFSIKSEVSPSVDHVSLIASALETLGYQSVREFKFLNNRKFRFDLALPEYKIAIEYEGGTFTGGRHTRGKGYSRDCKKYNLAVLNGWRVLRYTSDVTKESNWEYQVATEVISLVNILRTYKEPQTT